MVAEFHLSSFRDKRILITGGAGFVGSHLSEQLVKVSKNIVSLDNYISGSVKNHISGVHYIDGDVCDINDIFKNKKFDFIFHFGEFSRVEKSLTEPNLALKNIYSSFPSLLEYWRKTGAKLIYSGSSTKFSENGRGRHLSPYAAAKCANTEIMVDYASWFRLPYTIVYFYNVYGGREVSEGQFSTVIGKFKRLVLQGETKLPVTLPGTQRRNFTHIDDIVNGILISAAMGEGDNYGIGAEQSYSILDVCHMLGCEPYYINSSPANRMDGELRIDNVIRLGWKQQHLLTDHLDEFKNLLRGDTK